MSIFEEGAQAYRAGKPKNDNPYSPKENRFWSWLEGYEGEQYDSDKRKVHNDLNNSINAFELSGDRKELCNILRTIANHLDSLDYGFQDPIA